MPFGKRGGPHVRSAQHGNAEAILRKSLDNRDRLECTWFEYGDDEPLYGRDVLISQNEIVRRSG